MWGGGRGGGKVKVAGRSGGGLTGGEGDEGRRAGSRRTRTRGRGGGGIYIEREIGRGKCGVKGGEGRRDGSGGGGRRDGQPYRRVRG